jgi:putative membrane protein
MTLTRPISVALCALLQAYLMSGSAAAQSAGTQSADAQNNAAAIAQRAASALQAAQPKPFNEQERTFIAKALAGGAFEVQAGQVGLKRAIDPGVKSYAQMLVAQHGQANKELAQLSSDRNAQPAITATLPADKRETIAMLEKTAGFDTAFIRSVGIEAHQADIALFEQAYVQTHDPQLKAWIGNKLPTLRDHLAQAQQTPLRNAPDKTPSSSGHTSSVPSR